MKSSFMTVGVAIWFVLATGCAGAGTPAVQSTPTVPDFWGERGPRAQLLLLGTFHFQDAGRDAYKPQFFCLRPLA